MSPVVGWDGGTEGRGAGDVGREGGLDRRVQSRRPNSIKGPSEVELRNWRKALGVSELGGHSQVLRIFKLLQSHPLSPT